MAGGGGVRCRKTLAFYYRHLTISHILGAYFLPSIPRVEGTEMNETDHALGRDFEVVVFKLQGESAGALLPTHNHSVVRGAGERSATYE